MPDPISRKINADNGWHALTQVMGKWIPVRLVHTSNARKGLRRLRGRR